VRPRHHQALAVGRRELFGRRRAERRLAERGEDGGADERAVAVVDVPAQELERDVARVGEPVGKPELASWKAASALEVWPPNTPSTATGAPVPLSRNWTSPTSCR